MFLLQWMMTKQMTTTRSTMMTCPPIPQPGCAVRVEDTLPLVPSDTGRAALLDWCPGAEDWHHNVFTPVKLSTLYHRFTSERTDDPKNALAFARELQDDTQLWGKLPARRFGQEAAVRAGVRAKNYWKAYATGPLQGDHKVLYCGAPNARSRASGRRRARNGVSAL